MVDLRRCVQFEKKVIFLGTANERLWTLMKFSAEASTVCPRFTLETSRDVNHSRAADRDHITETLISADLH